MAEHIAQTGRKVDILLIVYVDDIIFGGTLKYTKRFTEAIKREFKIKSKQRAEEFIGVELNQRINKRLSQRQLLGSI